MEIPIPPINDPLLDHRHMAVFTLHIDMENTVFACSFHLDGEVRDGGRESD